MNKNLTNLVFILNMIGLLSVSFISNAMEDSSYSQEAANIVQALSYLDLASIATQGGNQEEIHKNQPHHNSLLSEKRDHAKLLKALDKKDLNTVKLLLEHGAQVTSDCWVTAWQKNDNALFSLLRRHLYNALANRAKEEDLELLNKSLWEGVKQLNLAHVHSLLKRKADVKSPLSKDNPITPLHYAIKRQHLGLVSLLLRYGANPDVRNEQTEKTYVDEAIELWCKNKDENSKHIYMLLVLHGGHFSPTWITGAAEGTIEAEKLYQSAYSDPQKLLYDAIIEGVHHQIIRALERGACLDRETPDNSAKIYDRLKELFVDNVLIAYILQQERTFIRMFSPLMLAIRYRQLESTEILLSRKAPITDNCMKLAQLYRSTDMINLLKNYKAIREKEEEVKECPKYMQMVMWCRNTFNFDPTKAKDLRKPRATAKTSSALRLSTSSDNV